MKFSTHWNCRRRLISVVRTFAALALLSIVFPSSVIAVGAETGTSISRESEVSQPMHATEEILHPLLEGLRNGPARGKMTRDQLREVLHRFLQGKGAHLGVTSERVLDHVRVVAGEGPFTGSAGALEEALGFHAAQLHQETLDNTECMLSVLITLYLYDRSTEQEHTLLEQQMAHFSQRINARLNKLITDADLATLYHSGLANKLLDNASEIRRIYIRDPLRPMFKYPLVEGEIKWVEEKLNKDLRELEAIVEEYTKELKKNTAAGQRPWYAPWQIDPIPGISKEIASRMEQHLGLYQNGLIRHVMAARMPGYFGLQSYASIQTPYKTTCSTIFPNDKQEAETFLRNIYGYFVMDSELERIANGPQ